MKHDTVYTDNHLKGHPELLEGYARLELPLYVLTKMLRILLLANMHHINHFYFIIIRYSVVFLNANVLQHMCMYTVPFLLNFSVFR